MTIDEPRTALGRRYATFAELRRLGTSPLNGRKTFRTETKKRRSPQQMPPWRLRFVIPDQLAFALSPGPIDTVVAARIVQIGQHLYVEVTGGPREWVTRQGWKAAKALHWDQSRLWARLDRSTDDTAPPVTGPYQRGEPHVAEINMATGSVTEGRAMRRLP